MAKGKQASEKVIAYKTFFSTKDGQIVLMDLIRQHHLWSDPGFHVEPTELARMAGERNVICYILALTGVSQEKLYELIKEEQEDAGR